MGRQIRADLVALPANVKLLPSQLVLVNPASVCVVSSDGVQLEDRYPARPDRD